jgi:hypothetical protein
VNFTRRGVKKGVLSVYFNCRVRNELPLFTCVLFPDNAAVRESANPWPGICVDKFLPYCRGLGGSALTAQIWAQSVPHGIAIG